MHTVAEPEGTWVYFFYLTNDVMGMLGASIKIDNRMIPVAQVILYPPISIL